MSSLLFFNLPVDAQVSAQKFVDLQQGKSDFPGFRRAHAKGVCVYGEFQSNGNLSSFSTASLFQKGNTAFIGRYSLAGNNPTAPDLKAPVRSLALSFNLAPNQQWRVAMNTPPVMAVKNPNDFYQQIVAIKQGGAAIKQFFENHPESADFLRWKANYLPTSSFALERYHSINAFYLLSASGQKQAVRWSMEPLVEDINSLNTDSNDALIEELALRLEQGVVSYDWVFSFATAQDDEHNPAKMWPNEREKVVAGKIVIHEVNRDQNADCQGINFDPLTLPSGILPTNDPILKARSAAYAESYRRRAKEQFWGVFK